jgi:ferric-dicitrate binding protein FerR (iron transport regulator)
MQPGELVEYNEQSADYRQKVVNPEVYTSWKNHQLVFEGTTIREIAQILEDNFGLEVVLTDDSLGQKEFKGSVPSHDLDILLQGLSASFNISVTREKNTIVIENKNPAAATESSD